VQQVGVPEEVYAQPANLHVARFMGYRNVLDLEVESEQGNRVVANGHGLRLHGVAKQKLGRKHIAAAIRPEEITVGSAGENIIEGRVQNAEYGGRDSLIDVVTPSGLVLHARTTQRVALDETVKLTVPAERVLLYPAEGRA
jgi:putative spermidine/putrescine transport system ATP-binding protein